MKQSFEVEIKTYNENLPSLLEHIGKYVLIKGDDVVDVFDAYEDALKEGYKKYDDAVFFVKKIAQAEQVSFFTRDILVTCQA